MTKINPESPTVRETLNTFKNRPIIIELHPGFMVFRVKGMRMKHSLSYEAGMDRAMKAEALRSIEEKHAGKPRKVSRGLLRKH